MNSVKDESHSRAMLDAYATVQNMPDKDKCLKDCVKSIRQSQVRRRMGVLQAQIKTAQDSKNDEEHLNKLLSEYSSLIRQKVEA